MVGAALFEAMGWHASDDVPPLEHLENDVDDDLAALDEAAEAANQGSALFSYAVLLALLLYLGACYVAFAFPPEAVPWEVEFAIPYDPAAMASNCSVAFTRLPAITSSRILTYEIAAISNTTMFHQVLQYTIHVDGVLVLTDLAILPRNETVAFTTHELSDLATGHHVASIELLVPLPGGHEERISTSRRFTLVPDGHKVVKVALPIRQSRKMLSLDQLVAASRPRIVAPLNGTVLRFHETDDRSVRVRYRRPSDGNTTLLLDGRPQPLPLSAPTEWVATTTLADVGPGIHVVTLLVGCDVADHVTFLVASDTVDMHL
ncbi:hypothetical protein SPRG_14148 [Saprolegnia parasitica CBS 223.65]|uniref:Uncharacterized protein n=1 Tax=Saprolegnia parasitica (strain CBS 223.65) TaxID=695850 RepID=A0A067C278_SAPPC|nr:hypothetical protein SPRG_14148 [Saprolegnia parasitica CBS 223.65]KDO20917.1 hypothetical protein SPRG_14148 [Saprolegnia parasitica CBS 223.65]|eukprot:XP_012208404.1 hypothetical protein SPRG_14148 [Saprolegnia parasitica CBS 223.65]